MKLQDALKLPKPLLADGATGTMLQSMGLPVGEAPERWTLERPEAIRRLATLYVAAGADLLFTNTFGASRVHLKRLNLEDKIAELNQTAVRLARDAANTLAGERTVHVVGSIGPTGEMIEPYGELSAAAARESFAEQARLLVAAGVDGLVCETFTDLNEAVQAVGAAREAAPELPVLASMAFDENNRTMMGVTPEDAVAQLSEAGAAVVGTNCSVGPVAVEKVIRAMSAARPKVRLLAKPNAGLPQMMNGKTVYLLDPVVLGEFATRMKLRGVAVIGGCCGTTPEHIRAMRQAIERAF
jgi:methionine synthase I (cobalamin-dependent)